LLLVAFLLVNAPNCHLSLALASVVQGDAVNCNTTWRSPWSLVGMVTVQQGQCCHSSWFFHKI